MSRPRKRRPSAKALAAAALLRRIAALPEAKAMRHAAHRFHCATDPDGEAEAALYAAAIRLREAIVDAQIMAKDR